MDNNQNFDWKVEEFDQPAEEIKPEPPKGEAIRAMIFGIISAYLSYAPFFSILSIIFGALAKKWAAPIIENYPYTGARLFAKAGYITGKIGVILGIIFTVIWALYFIGMIAAMTAAVIG